MKKYLFKPIFSGICLTAVLMSAGSSQAITINDPGVIGIIEDGSPSDFATEIIYANHLLGLAANTSADFTDPNPINTHTYTRGSNADPGSGSVSSGVQGAAGDASVPAGFEYVIGKYGDNDVLWYLGGAAMVLPTKSGELWEKNDNGGAGLSHWAGFNGSPSVPDSGSTIALLGLALTGVGFVRGRVLKA